MSANDISRSSRALVDRPDPQRACCRHTSPEHSSGSGTRSAEDIIDSVLLSDEEVLVLAQFALDHMLPMIKRGVLAVRQNVDVQATVLPLGERLPAGERVSS